MKSPVIPAAVLATSLMAGCVADDPNKRAKTGAAVGALLGAVIGHQVDDKSGRYIGAAVGALAGGAVGHYMDKQYAELQKQLAAEAARKELKITKLPGNALKVGLASDASFDVASAELKGQAHQTYGKIASVLKDYDQTVIHVVGHTDSDGSDEYNRELSQRRASAVAGFMEGSGLPRPRVLTEGRGEREPVASNQNSSGKRANRRVDIVIQPVIEGREQEAYNTPPYLGS